MKRLVILLALGCVLTGVVILVKPIQRFVHSAERSVLGVPVTVMNHSGGTIESGRIDSTIGRLDIPRIERDQFYTFRLRPRPGCHYSLSLRFDRGELGGYDLTSCTEEALRDQDSGIMINVDANVLTVESVRQRKEP